MNVKVAPEYDQLALELIEMSLGYIPAYDIYLPHLPFYKALLDNHTKGNISDEEFATESLLIKKAIRNDDMKNCGWVSRLEYNQQDYEMYDNFLAEYKEEARKRLTQFMGYEPFLEHSLSAELLLRNLCSSEEYYTGMPMCSQDYRAITIAHYRGLFLVEGEKAADESLVMGLNYRYGGLPD